jgi:hypothetical protein
MRRSSILPVLFALSLGCRAAVQSAAQPAPDDGLGELLRAMVTDSLVGGGQRPDQKYVGANAASDTLLRAAGLVLGPRSDIPSLACPGSTDTAAGSVASAVGYVVRVDRLEQVPGVLRLGVTVSCAFVYRGEVRGFAQGSVWELRQVGGRWRIARTLSRGIT